ncbi:MAG: cell surface protein SprA [Bacteroidales bacterium]|nr:cell surface protein SprA [Bacteroidales bacterium]
MKKNLLPLIQFSIITSTLLTLGVMVASPNSGERLIEMLTPPDSVPDTTGGLRYRFNDVPLLQGDQIPVPSAMHLKQPSNIKTEVEYDPATNSYVVKDKIGELDYRSPRVYDFKEYQELDANRTVHNYFKEKAKSASGGSGDGIIPSIYIGGQTFDRIFGGSTIDIRPTGSAELIFGLTGNRRDDPTLSERQRSTLNFDFQEKIQMNVVAKIGKKIEFKANYNTETSFNFENKLQLKYEGEEDEIIKLIEVGNVNLPLNSTLIQGSQSLFGVKSKMKFGKTTVTAVVSQQESQTSSITVQGGAQTNTFSLKADQYEENKHFFLAQYFRDNYETGLSRLPIVISNVNITKMEVWVTNIGAAVTDNRNIVAFQDLGEPNPYNPVIDPVVGRPPYPDNEANRLLNQLDINIVRDINQVSNYLKGGAFMFTAGVDFEKVESARKLTASEYSYNNRLGFISLNTTLNSDQTLAVAFQYTVAGDTAVHQVGEFSDDGISAPRCLMVKLLKSTAVNTRIPLWNLMMKNVYSLGSYQINAQDFILNVLYSGNSNGVPTGYINEGAIAGVPLIQVMNVDNLDAQNNRVYIVKDGDSILIPDGIFDFLDNAAIGGGTINSKNGRVYFPVLEPFGSYLRKKIGDDSKADRYCYDSLYTMTKVGAQQYPDKNKFLIDGFYKSSSSSEISLNALNVPQGSVTVMMGGVKLNENVDYTVDYTLGRVRIINEALLSSGTPINISLENNSMFSIQSKTYLGMHVDHEFTKDFVMGATVINLTERPLTQKTILGDDPISNTLWGLNLSYQQESQLITRLIDKLPGIETKAPSKITVNAEFAHFIPGHSSAIGSEGTSYIDDFEGAQTSIRLSEPYWWFMASTPQGQTEQGMFPEAALGTGLAYGYNRAKLAWYTIDPIFYDRSGGTRPTGIEKDELSKNSVRQVLENEVFPNKEIPNGQVTNISVLNLAYYPDERGMNNYDVEPTAFSAGIAENGKLNSPSSRWGGIMRKIESTDFEATNVEYIEFWMMDPFTEDPEQQGGDLYFNLGDISEDILRDSRKSFENGLPTSTTIVDVDTTIWGRVPKQQALVNSFDNNAGTRIYQDIGYDGLNDDDERIFFNDNYIQRIINKHGVGSEAYNLAYNDPSADNYHYFRGTDYDNDDVIKASVLERYKKYNGVQGNSPNSDDVNETYITSATDVPNVEDINFDNTLWEDERYFQYKVSIRPEDMMEVGKNYITDIYTTKSIALENGDRTTVKWYQFKIPVSDPTKIVGDIKDFKSIRFIRMFFKNFNRPIVTRFATLELVRGEWRRYKYDLLSAGEYIPNDDQWGAKFELSTVNVEENGSKSPIPYVIPPGIEREINYGSTNYTRLNEQAMVLRLRDLIDGDARAAYKTTGFDFRQYKRLKMFVHAEDIYESQPNAYGDLTIFLRLGSDFTQNYYEYEIPLTFTAWGTKTAEDIWPEANRFDIDLERLVSIKQQRNVDLVDGISGVLQSIPYIAYDGKNKISVVGSPSLSDVRAIMIGVRNPKRQTIQSLDDGNPKSAEIWVNELRLSDFVDEQGWAATARFTATLADLGNVAVAGSYSTPGFGSIEKKANERQKETVQGIDFSTNLQLGKFFPERFGIKIPFHFDYSHTVKTPQYNPLDPDVKMDDALASLSTDQQRDSLSRIAEDLVQRKNFSFLNVRKERVGNTGTPMPWDVENFDVSYSYSETNIHNIDLEFDNKRTYRGGLGYNYQIQPPLVKPFEKIGFIAKSKSLKLIKDFNFYYLPRTFSFRTDMNRDYTERKLRNKSTADVLITPSYLKSFVWNRTYDLKFDLTQSLKLEYNASANALIDELPGSIDKDDYYTVDEKREEIWNNITGFGRMNRYNQQVNANYTIPINKIPLLDWVTASARYQGTFTWTASARSIQEVMGNTIENSNSKQINGQFKFTTLYNKIGYLKKLNQPARQAPKGPGMPRPGTQPRNQQKPADSTKKDEGPSYAKIVADQILRLAMMVRDGRISYTETNGTMLPGVTYTPGLLGSDFDLSAPGVGFIFGMQDDIRYRAAEGRWLTEDTLFNGAYATKYTTSLNLGLTLEPFRDLKIDLTGTRTYSLDHSEYFRVTDGNLDSYSEVDRGSFSISYLTIGTAFSSIRDDNTSEVYEKMKDYRLDVARRLAQANPNWVADPQWDSLGFPLGYGRNQQEVMHYAFLAAYSNKTPGAISTDAFPKIPLPNWRITYKGLMSIDFIKEYLKDITLSHTYRSTYNVGSFTSNVLYLEKNGAPSSRDAANNYIPLYQISQIAITEQFVPLFGVDMTWKNSLLSRFELKKTRNLAMSFTNGQITEVASNEIVIGLGYRIKDLQLVFKGGGSPQKFKSDLNLKADFSIKDNKTVLRRIEEDIDQVSSGTRVISLSISADYQMNQRLNLRAFFEKTLNNPYVSNQYSTSVTKGGISLRFSLAQ